MIKRIVKRFLRGFIATLLPTLAALLQSNDIGASSLYAVILSSIAAGLLALDKLYREASKESV